MRYVPVARAILVAFILGICVPAFADVHGVLRVVKGDVQIKLGSTGQTGRARLGQEIYPKDTIITGKDARAKIVMIDNNELNISPDSNVEIQNYEYNPGENKKDVLLNVLYGKVRSKVEQKYDGKTSKFQVKTPSAVAGVRGTDFMTSYDRGTKQSQVITFRGAVEFGIPGVNGAIKNGVSVTPGKIASVSPGGNPSTPTNMSKDGFAKADHATKVEGDAGDKGGGKDPRAPAGKGNNGNGANGSSNGNSNSSGGSASGSSGSSSGGSSMGAPGASTGGGDTSRGVASTGGASGGSMLMPSEDLANGGGSGGGAAAPAPNSGPPPPPAPPAAPPKPPGPPPVCQTCNQIIQGGSGKLTVHVNQ